MTLRSLIYHDIKKKTLSVNNMVLISNGVFSDEVNL